MPPSAPRARRSLPSPGRDRAGSREPQQGVAPVCVEGSFGRAAKLTGKRVLVVEDEALVSMLVEDQLHDAGATVLGPAPSVPEALRLVAAAAADGGISAAVLDINLDGQHVRPVADRL